MSVRRMLNCAVLMTIMLVLAGSVVAQRKTTDSWKGGTGNWSVGSDWSGGVPNSSSSVTINSGGTDLVTLNQNATIASLVLGGTSGSSTLQDASGTPEKLTITGATTINSTGDLFFQNGSTLSSGSLTVSGSLYLLAGSTGSTSGNVTLNSGSSEFIGGASKLTVNGNLTNNSTSFYTGIYYGGGSTLTVTGGLTNDASLSMYGNYNGGGGDTLIVNGALTNASGATLQLIDGSSDVATIGTLSNSGTLYIGTGTSLNLTNQPNGITDVVAGSSLTVNGTFTAGSSNGLAKLGSIEGTLTLGNGSTTSVTPGSGTLMLASTGILAVNNTGTTLSITGGMSDQGSLTVNTGTTLNATQSMTDLPSTGSFNLYGSSNALAKLTTVEGSLLLQNQQTTSVTPNGGTLTFNSGSSVWLTQASGLTVNGTLVNDANLVTGIYYGGGNTLTVTGGFTNNGNLTMYGNVYNGGSGGDTLNVTGTLTNGSGGTLDLYDNSADVVNIGTLSNSGSLYIGLGDSLNLTNQPNGMTDVVAGSSLTVNGTFTAGSANGLAKLGSIEGSLTLGNGVTTNATPGSGTLTLASGSTLTLNNTGTILSITGGLSDQGTVTVNAGSTLNLTQSMTDLPLTGSFSLYGSTNALSELTTVEGSLVLQNQQTTSVTPNGGTLTLNSNSGLWVTQGSGLTVNGNLTNDSSGFYTGIYYGGGNTLTVTGGFTNNGTLTMYGNVYNGGSGGDTLNVTGTLTNAAGASLDFYDNSGDVANVGTLSNSGSIYIGLGDSLNLTNQPNGITDVAAGSSLTVNGTFTAGSANALAKLGSIEGSLTVGNGVTTNVTPGGGTLTLASGGTLTVSNTGTILSITGGLSDQGTVDVGSGATLNATTGMTDLPAGGAFTLDGSTNTLAKLTTVEGALTLQNGQTTSITPNGGTLTFNSSSGLNLYAASGLTVNGNLTNNSTSLNTGFYGGGGNTLTVTGNFTNNGSLNMFGDEGGTGGGGDTLNVTGTFTNAAGATLQLYGSSNDVANIHTLSNSGTINADSGTALNLTANGTDTNNGTINVGDSNGAATLKINGTAVTLSGTGSIVLANGSIITSASSSDILTSANTISGTGNIGNGVMGFVNTGTVNANQTTALTIQAGSKGFNNKGTIEATASGGLVVTGTFLNYTSGNNTLTGGTYTANGGNVTLPLGTSGSITTLAAAAVEENGGQILNSNSSNSNALSGLTSITSAGSLTIGGIAFTDSGTFSNAGSLTILSGESFTVGSLSQISGSTLTAGTYVLDANLNLSGATQNITTNAGNVTLSGGTIENANATNALAGLATNSGKLTLASGATFTTTGNFSSPGSLTVNKGSKFTVSGTLAQISGSTLTGGTFVLGGNLVVGSGISLTTNSGNLTLEGGTIQSGAANALSALATNTGGLTIDAAITTTAASFSNTGTLTVDKGESFTAGNLAQISSGSLTAGTYVLAGNLDLTTSGISITSNAANLTLEGGTINSNGVNALSALASNSGSLTLASNAKLTTASGSFTNTGTVDVQKGSTLTVGGTGNRFNQTSGTTTVDGSVAGVSGAGSANFTGGTVQGAGSISGNVSAGNASGTAVTINAGDSGKAGILAITGTYTQLATGTFTGLISGTAQGSAYSELKVTGAASLAGTISFTVASSFQASLKLGETFTVLTAKSITGTFSNSTIAINSTYQFDVSYTSTGVMLTVASATPAKPAGAPARPVTAIAGVHHKGSAVGALAKPIFVEGAARSHRYAGIASDRLPAERFEHIYQATNRVAERPAQILAVAHETPAQNLPASRVWLGSGLQVAPVSNLGGAPMRRLARPVPVLPSHIPVMTPR